MNFLNVPENILFKTLESILRFLRQDLEQNESTPQESFLFKICGDEKGADGRFSYFKEAKKIFTYKVDDPKFLELTLMFNMQSIKPNTINISHSGESQGQGSIGQDTNSYGVYINTDDSYQDTFGDRFNATYLLTIVTENTNETIIIYHIIKTMLIAFKAHFTFMGLANIKLGGQDIQIKSEHVPPYMNQKVITFGCEYQAYSLDIYKQQEITGIIYNGILKNQ